VSEFPRAPKTIADLFLKKVLARMEANREATKLLKKDFIYVPCPQPNPQKPS